MIQSVDSKKNAPLGRFSLLYCALWIGAIFFLIGWGSTNHFPPWVSWYSEVPFFVAVLAGSAVAIFSKRKYFWRQGVLIPVIAVPFVLLITVMFMQLVSGQIVFAGHAYVWAIYLSTVAAALTLGFCLAIKTGSSGQEGSPAVLIALACTFIAGAILLIGAALAQTLQVWDSSSWIVRMNYIRRPGGNLGQPNHLATLLVMAIASTAYLFDSRHLGRRSAMLVLSYLLLGLAITESRAGFLSLFGLYFWWLAKRRHFQSSCAIWPTLIFALAFVAGYVLWPQVFSFLQSETPATETSRIAQAPVDVRLTVWPQLINAAILKPWFGWGLGQTAAAHSAVVHSHDLSQAFSYSHNLVIDLMIWIGFPLTLLLILVVGVWLLKRLREIKCRDSWFGFAVVLPLAIHSLLEFPFAYAYLLFPAFIALGAAEAKSFPNSGFRMDGRVAAICLTVLSTVSVWSAVEYLQVEEEFRTARFRMLRIGPDSLNEAGVQPVLLTQLGAMVRSTRLELRPHMESVELHLLRDVALQSAWSAPQYRYAMALALNNQPTEARRMLAVIRALHGAKTHYVFSEQIDEKLRQSGMSPLKSP